MRVIPTRVHGGLDYLVSVIVSISPWILNFPNGGAETWIPVAFGAGGILYSIMTDYEWGVVRKLPMRTHLMLDILAGVVLASSPWFFGFYQLVYVPHLVFGIIAIIVPLLTDPVPADRNRNREV